MTQKPSIRRAAAHIITPVETENRKLRFQLQQAWEEIGRQRKARVELEELLAGARQEFANYRQMTAQRRNGVSR